VLHLNVAYYNRTMSNLTQQSLGRSYVNSKLFLNVVAPILFFFAELGFFQRDNNLCHYLPINYAFNVLFALISL
jgi:hypothetical protein